MMSSLLGLLDTFDPTGSWKQAAGTVALAWSTLQAVKWAAARTQAGKQMAVMKKKRQERVSETIIFGIGVDQGIGTILLQILAKKPFPGIMFQPSSRVVSGQFAWLNVIVRPPDYFGTNLD
jgi:hypothetical protein